MHRPENIPDYPVDMRHQLGIYNSCTKNPFADGSSSPKIHPAASFHHLA